MIVWIAALQNGCRSFASLIQACVSQHRRPQAAAELELGLGEGAKIFRAEKLRDPNGRLLPAPAALLSPESAALKSGKGLAGILGGTVEARSGTSAAFLCFGEGCCPIRCSVGWVWCPGWILRAAGFKLHFMACGIGS